jgi:Kef-type K+ transport system membrane component KefB
MSKISKGWWAFIVIEIVAVISCLTWQFFTTPFLGKALWIAQFFLLMPGSITIAPVVEKALWNTGLSLTAIGVAEIVASVVTNAVLWFLLLEIVRRLRRRDAL